MMLVLIHENGDPWMRVELKDAIDRDFIRCALDLKPVPKEKDDEYKEGFLLDREPEVLTRGHLADDDENIESRRVDKLAEKANFSNYGQLLPTRRSFPAMVRITGYVIAFVTRCRMRADRRHGANRGWSGKLLAEASIWFSAFPITTMASNMDTYKMKVWVNLDRTKSDKELCCLVQSFAGGLNYEDDDAYYKVHAADPMQPTDRYLNSALLYYFRVASLEVLKFNSQQVVDRRTEMKDGVLLSKGRIIEGMNFIETADLDTLNLDNLCICAKHKGMETCLRYSLEHVHIMQGMSLFKELSEECIRCKIKRGRFIKASMGQFIVAPPFFACQVDLFGPCRVFVPGYEKETRATKVKESKVWLFVIVCVVTSTVNIQVCEMKNTAAMLEAFIRMSCEVE